MSVYPRVHKCGIVAWYFLDGQLKSVAFNSLPLRGATEVISRFGPDELIIESQRENKWEPGELYVEGVSKLRYVPTHWSTEARSIPSGAYFGRLSPLAHRAFSLGFYSLFQKGGYSLWGKPSLRELTPEWLDEFARY